MDESSSITSAISILVALILTDALISLAYAAVINSKDALPDETSRQSPLKRRLALTGQFSILMLRFSVAAASVTLLVIPLSARWENLPTALFYVLVMLPVALIMLVVGEVAPTMIGTSYADRLAPFLKPPYMALDLLMRPFTALASLASTGMTYIFGANSLETIVTEEQLLAMVDADETLEDGERKMIQSVLQMDSTSVTEMMVPRIDIVAVEKSTSIAGAREVFLESGHSRLPVYEETIDNVVGIVYVKDLLEVWHNGDTVVGSVAEIMRPAHFVPESMTADRLLHLFQRNKVHMLIVLEEYGGTGGLVTMEDLLEEIVGDIQDEYDENEPEEIVQIAPNEYRVDAGVSIYDINERLDVELSDEEVDTLGGYIFMMLERLPVPGDVVLVEDTLEIQIKTIEGRRIREVLVKKLIGNASYEESEAPNISPSPVTDS